MLIVIGGVAEPDPLVPTMQTDCGDRMQGVLVNNRIPIPSSLVNFGVACASTSVDEKVYRIIYDDEKHRLPFQLNEQALVDGLALTLDVVDGHCRLTYDDAGTVRHVPLDLPPPCRFMRGEGAGVRTEKYTSSGYVVTVLIVIGGTAGQDSWMPATLRVDCGDHVQGVLISDGKAIPTSKVVSGEACAGVGLHQGVYRFFYDDEKARLPF